MIWVRCLQPWGSPQCPGGRPPGVAGRRWGDNYTENNRVDQESKDVLDGKINPFTKKPYANDKELPTVRPRKLEASSTRG